jgi:Protein of unknown function (DUF3237)
MPTTSTKVITEYLMTMHAPGGGTAHAVDSSLSIFFTGEGGSVHGLRTMPSGSRRVDARVTLLTDDGATIFITYGGVLSVSEETFAEMRSGETMTSSDLYFIVTPTFQTSHERYAWLNHIQAIGKLVAVKIGPGGFVTYDFFSVR